MIKLNQILNEDIKKDLILIRKNLGEEWKNGNPKGRGKGQYFDNRKLVDRIKKYFPIKKYPNVLYRGINIVPGTKYYNPIFQPSYEYRNDSKYYKRKQKDIDDYIKTSKTKKFRNIPLTNYASGIRSWSSKVSGAKFYMKSEINFLFKWNNPNPDNIYLSSNEIEELYPNITGLDSNEFIAEYNGTTILNIEEKHRNVSYFGSENVSDNYLLIEII